MRKFEKNVPGRKCSCPGKGGRMKALVMTADELRAYIRCLPEQVILRVIIQEVRDGTEENEEV